LKLLGKDLWNWRLVFALNAADLEPDKSYIHEDGEQAILVDGAKTEIIGPGKKQFSIQNFLRRKRIF